ncbi:MAG: ATP-binding protein [Bacteroidetes bacterium]|nr:ATP-binding protein [Bacteroidota bacterium]
MQTSKLFYRFNPWWEDGVETFNQLKNRKGFDVLVAKLKNKQVVLLTGLRRVGKTTLMKLLIKQLIQLEGVKATNCFYVSLDHYLLKDKSILEIIEEYRTLHKIPSAEKVYLFLDEITFAKDYALQLKNLYDNENAKVFASSSSASLLKNEAAYLTGRNSLLEIMPLDFDEYLNFKEIKIKKADAQLRESYFRDYLTSGGIPEYVLTNDSSYLFDLVDNIIYKDIAAINGIKQIDLLKDFFLLLMERAGKQVSINKVSSVLGISTQTGKHYLELFAQSYLVHLVGRYGKLNEQLVSPKKAYACDTGIRTAYTGQRDWGSVFENYVFLRLKHLNLRYIKENGIELDFISENKTLIECKFHDEALSKKQQALFDAYAAKTKYIIRKESDIKALLKG